MAQWHVELQDYNFQIVHILGKSHVLADMLSHLTGVDQGENDNTDVTMIKEKSSIWVFTKDDMYLEQHIEKSQNKHALILDNWSSTEKLIKQSLAPCPGSIWKHPESLKMVIPPDDELRWQIMKEWHDNPIAGHPGQDETMRQVLANYHWPNAWPWIKKYIKGCMVCQQMKNLTHKLKMPLYPISVPQSPRPFRQIAMDLITGLPLSHGYDAILTIVDHGCTRIAVFLPCQMTITRPGIAQLYLHHLYPWFGIPNKIILDRDLRFTSHFGQSLAQELGIMRNLFMAFHPQMDGLTEHMNQWVEQYLRLLATNQEEWSSWLPVTTAVHNNRMNATIKRSLHQLLLGFNPPLSPDWTNVTSNPLVREQVEMLKWHHEMVAEAINKKNTTLTAKWSIG